MLVKAGLLSWQMMYTHFLYNSVVVFYGQDGMNIVTSIAADDRTAIQSTFTTLFMLLVVLLLASKNLVKLPCLLTLQTLIIEK